MLSWWFGIFPPSHAGTITVYEDSQPGTLNDFLGAMSEDDVRPEALRRFELMVEEVARHAEEAKKNAGEAETSPARRILAGPRVRTECPLRALGKCRTTTTAWYQQDPRVIRDIREQFFGNM